MPFSLHEQLKELYSDGKVERTEVPLGKYRIDVVKGKRLIEVQAANLSSIRDKIRELTPQAKITIVKPVIRSKVIVQVDSETELEMSRRKSPKTGKFPDLFLELVYFSKVYPHPNLTLEVVLVDVEEYRKKKNKPKRRKFSKDYRIVDQKLTSVHDKLTLKSAADLEKLLPGPVPAEFDTDSLRELYSLPRWLTQKIAYCLRETGMAEIAGKKGNQLLYRRLAKKRRADKVVA